MIDQGKHGWSHEIFESIRDDLARVEHKLRENPGLEYEVLTQAIEHLLSSGGKRIRPALVILTSRLYSAADRARKIIALAAAIEMLHTASLVHDDLIDGSLLRRGIPTLNATWTPGATILTGDYMFARAADLAAQTGNLRVMRLFAETLMVICTGELKQQFSDLHTRAAAEMIIMPASMPRRPRCLRWRRKRPACWPTRRKSRWRHCASMAMIWVWRFRWWTMCWILSAMRQRMGKPVGSDLRQGLVTLPTLCYLEQHPDDELIVRILAQWTRQRRGHSPGRERDPRLRARLMRRWTRRVALRARSLSALERLPAGPPCQAMQDLADFVVQRRT